MYSSSQVIEAENPIQYNIKITRTCGCVGKGVWNSNMNHMSFFVQKEEHELKRVIIQELKHGKQIKTEEIDAKMMQKRYRIDVSWLYNVNDEENV